jgi:LytS/YehU family sensor histidine kinase
LALLSTNSRLMDIVFYKVCALVTVALLLTLVPGLTQSGRSLLSLRGRWRALLVFLVLGLVEEIAVRRTGWRNHRVVVVCAAGLLGGRAVGLTVATLLISMAVFCDGRPLPLIGIPLLSGGLIGGWLRKFRPTLAQHPVTGFGLGFAVSLLRDGLSFFYPNGSPLAERTIVAMGLASVVQGLGTALILVIVDYARKGDDQAKAAVGAEIRALVAGMNPHFLIGALNALAKLAPVAPREIPVVAGRMRKFLRACFDQQDQLLIPLEEELAVLSAYLDIESLRFGSRFKVEETIDPGLAKFLIPPFSLQPLVENAVRHGVHLWSGAGGIRIEVRSSGQWLQMTVSDDGRGVSSSRVEEVFFAERPETRGLLLLRRRLERLFNRSFQLDVHTDVGHGTAVTIRIPLQPAPLTNPENSVNAWSRKE